mgnify:CR=1 FL=1
MSEDSKKSIRLSKAAIEFNIGREVIVEFLSKKGYKLDSSPNTKLDGEIKRLRKMPTSSETLAIKEKVSL